MKHENHDGASTGHGSKLSEPLDLSKIHSIDGLVRAMTGTASTGRKLGEAADILETMARDQDCFVVMTLAGAMTVAKQGLIISDLIDRGIVNAIVSTGALMLEGFGDANVVPEPPRKIAGVQEVMAQILEEWDHNEVMCSYKLNHAIGTHLVKRAKDQRGILQSASEKGVPVFVPAFADSELGLDVALSNRLRESTGRHRLRFDPFEDLDHFAATLLRQKRLGIFSVGGGAPRIWAQQFGSFIELRHRRMGENVPLKRYDYGLRISSERDGMSASAAVSSREFVPPTEGGMFSEVFVDSTVGLPLIVAAVLERLGPHKPPNGSTSKPAKKSAKK